MSSPARKALDFFKGILYNKVRSCVPKNKEAYRSGHNGPDSKADSVRLFGTPIVFLRHLLLLSAVILLKGV